MRRHVATRGPAGSDVPGAVRTTVLAGLAAIGVTLGGATRQRSQLLTLPTSMPAVPDERPDAGIVSELGALAYELLDAHTDTALLAADLTVDPSWAAHLDYLRGLQRKGREMLAHTLVDIPIGADEQGRPRIAGRGAGEL